MAGSDGGGDARAPRPESGARPPELATDAEALLRGAFEGARPRPRPAPPRESGAQDRGQAGTRDRALVEQRLSGIGSSLRPTFDHARAWLDAGGREGRAATIHLAVEGELSRARRVVMEARDISKEPFRADMVAVAGTWAAAGADELDAALDDLWRAADRVEVIARALAIRLSDLDRLTDPKTWSSGWSGCSRGRGIPGYDTDVGVATVAREIRDAVEAAATRKLTDNEKRAEKAREKAERRRAGTVGGGVPARLPSLFDAEDDDADG